LWRGTEFDSSRRRPPEVRRRWHPDGASEGGDERARRCVTDPPGHPADGYPPREWRQRGLEPEIGDTMVVVDAKTFPDRLRAAGFGEVDVAHEPKRRIRFRAGKA
jgi:hypothetical protein